MIKELHHLIFGDTKRNITDVQTSSLSTDGAAGERNGGVQRQSGRRHGDRVRYLAGSLHCLVLDRAYVLVAGRSYVPVFVRLPSLGFSVIVRAKRTKIVTRHFVQERCSMRWRRRSAPLRIYDQCDVLLLTSVSCAVCRHDRGCATAAGVGRGPCRSDRPERALGCGFCGADRGRPDRRSSGVHRRSSDADLKSDGIYVAQRESERSVLTDLILI